MSEKNSAPKGDASSQGSEGQKKAGSLIPGVLAVLLALLLVTIVFAGVFFVALKNDAFGLGEQFRPQLQENPILRLALPKIPEVFDADAPENLSDVEVRKRYEEYRALAATLQDNLDAANTSIAALEAENLSMSGISADAEALQEANATTMAAIDARRAELEVLSLAVAEAAAKGDTGGFKQYFEKLDPEAAAEIYKTILSSEATEAFAKQAARPFEVMDRKKAAEVMKELWTKDKPLLIAIVAANKPQTLAEIMAEMDAVLAADITQSLADYRKTQAQK